MSPKIGPVAMIFHRLSTAFRDILFNRRRSKMHLSEAEALRKAQSVADRCGISDILESFGVRTIDHQLCWIIGTSDKDASWSIIVEDVSGITHEPELWNGWNGSSRPHSKGMKDEQRTSATQK
jgi:hypothetical protein